MSNPFPPEIVYPVVREVLEEYEDAIDLITSELALHLTPIVAQKAAELVANHLQTVAPIDVVTMLLAEMERVNLIHHWLLKEHQGEEFRKVCEREFPELDASYQALVRFARKHLPLLPEDPVFEVARPAGQGGEA